MADNPVNVHFFLFEARDMKVDHLDHVVLTVADIEKSIAFYVAVLGMEAVTSVVGGLALRKIKPSPSWPRV